MIICWNVFICSLILITWSITASPGNITIIQYRMFAINQEELFPHSLSALEESYQPIKLIWPHTLQSNWLLCSHPSCQFWLIIIVIFFQMFMSPDPLKYICNVVSYPPSVNRTVIRNLLCKANSSVLLEELKAFVRWDTVMAEVARISANKSQDVDWEKTVRNIMYLQEKFTALFSNMSAPTLDSIFPMNGDWNAWLKKLEEATQSTTQQDIPKL